MTPSPEHIELAGARARIRELETAIREWYETLPGADDRHDGHTRIRYWSECPGCIAECNLALLDEQLPDPAVADKESTDN